MKRFLGATIAYYVGVLLEILLFRPSYMEMKWDGGKYEGNTVIALAANVEKSSGGSMVVGPGATPTDGKMTVTIVPYKSKYDCLIKKLPKTPTGEIINEPGVRHFRTTKITIKSTPQCIMDIDGDNYVATAATLEICPKALRVVCSGEVDK
jgi:diacylglycerol kinase family enzyme